MSNKNINELGYAIICLWCNKNKTTNEESNICSVCLEKKSKERGKDAHLIIYDKI